MRRGGTVQWDDDQNKNFMVSVVVSENFSGKSLLEQKIIIESIQDKIPRVRKAMDMYRHFTDEDVAERYHRR